MTQRLHRASGGAGLQLFLAAALLLVLLCSLANLGGAAARQLQQDQDALWSKSKPGYFVLVRQWPGTLCSQQHDCPLLQHREWSRFTIHGLWPNNADGTYPASCSDKLQYDEAKVKDLRPDLEDVWPSLTDEKSSDNFWAHEWDKHGTCSLKVLPSQHKFFKAVLDLNHRFSLSAALQSSGIAPSSSRTYSRDAVAQAVRHAYGVDPLLHCLPDGRLTEVWMCLDLDLQPMECSTALSGGRLGGAEDAQSCKHITLAPLPGSRADEGWGWRDGQQLSIASRTSDPLDPAQPSSSSSVSVSSTNSSSSSSSTAGAYEEEVVGGASSRLSTTHATSSAPKPRRRATPQPNAAVRTLCIAGAGAMLAGVVVAMVASSWARHRTAAAAEEQLQVEEAEEEEGEACGDGPGPARTPWCDGGSTPACGPRLVTLGPLQSAPAPVSVSGAAQATGGSWRALQLGGREQEQEDGLRQPLLP